MSGAAPATGTPVQVGANPFSLRAVLALVLFGSAVFIALLWMIGNGMTDGNTTNNGEAHVGSNGLTGYAALAAVLEKQGYPVNRVRNAKQLKGAGLVVLTPPQFAKGKDLARIIEARRMIGPTLLILPKWQEMKTFVLPGQKGSQKGWVSVTRPRIPEWGEGFDTFTFAPKIANQVPQKPGDGGYDDGEEEKAARAQKGAKAFWQAHDVTGELPDRRYQHLGDGPLTGLVHDREGNVLVGYLQDSGYYPNLAKAAGVEADTEESSDYRSDEFPLIVVAEPDLFNNWGMSDERRAMQALSLIDLVMAGKKDPISFDLSQNGFERSDNLLTLAFQPPFLAATLCLLLAALVAGWRAFRRYGPPLAAGRAIAFGKRELVANAAGLVRRSGRLHLLGAPYAALYRDRLARTLALPRQADAQATEAAIDRALAARAPDATPFSIVAAQLRSARRPAELLRAGQALHALERILTR